MRNDLSDAYRNGTTALKKAKKVTELERYQCHFTHASKTNCIAYAFLGWVRIKELTQSTGCAARLSTETR